MYNLLHIQHWVELSAHGSARVEKLVGEGRRHLKFVCELYRMQLRAGRHFLHEHPAGATNWREDCMKNVLANSQVGTVVSHQCEYGLLVPDKKRGNETCDETDKMGEFIPENAAEAVEEMPAKSSACTIDG